MKLYVDISDELDPVRFRPASPAELLEAARPHADLEAAGRVHAGTEVDDDYIDAVVRPIVWAALGADDENY